jgi:nucleoside-diphosphate-sugar epimerase
MQRRVPDLAKIHALVGYRPEISLDQLLQETIEHVRAGIATPTTLGMPVR